MGENKINIDIFLEKVNYTFNLNFINYNYRKQVYRTNKINKLFKFKHKMKKYI